MLLPIREVKVCERHANYGGSFPLVMGYANIVVTHGIKRRDYPELTLPIVCMQWLATSTSP